MLKQFYKNIKTILEKQKFEMKKKDQINIKVK